MLNSNEIKTILEFIRKSSEKDQIGEIKLGDYLIKYDRFIDEFDYDTLEIQIYKDSRIILKRCSTLESVITEIEIIFENLWIEKPIGFSQMILKYDWLWAIIKVVGLNQSNKRSRNGNENDKSETLGTSPKYW